LVGQRGPGGSDHRQQQQRRSLPVSCARTQRATKCATTVTAVNPASDTVWVNKRSTSREGTGTVPTASAIGTSPVSSGAISASWWGQSASDRATQTIAISAATTAAKPVHCIRRRSMAPALR
jgi:hypothetical protein